MNAEDKTGRSETFTTSPQDHSRDRSAQSSFEPHPGDYLIGAIRCSYGVPGHITYGALVSGSAPFG